MSSRTGMRMQMERQKVLEEEKSRNNHSSKIFHDNFHSSYKNLNDDSSSYNETYLPSLNPPISNITRNFDYCESFVNNHNGIQYNTDPSHSYLESDEFILNAHDPNQIRNMESPYVISPQGYSYDKYSVQQYNPDFLVDNKLDHNKINCQFHDMSNNNLPLPHDINKNEFSFSCPVTGEQTDVAINHALSSVNFVHTPNSSVQGQYGTEDRRNTSLRDRYKKENHNRIERKRRDFINQQITELGILIPPHMATEGESKKNKGIVLKNSVDYIVHLQNEVKNIPNYIKETELAFMLIENYRRRNQELEYQNQSYNTQNMSPSVDIQNLSTNYNNYLSIHDQNLRFNQNNCKFSNIRNGKPKTPDPNRRSIASMNNKQRLSPSESNIAFKIEPSSAHSSVGNNSLSTTYRIEEETDLSFKIVEDIQSPRNNYQNINNHTSLPSIHSEAFFSSNTRFRCMDNHKCESMEC